MEGVLNMEKFKKGKSGSRKYSETDLENLLVELEAGMPYESLDLSDKNFSVVIIHNGISKIRQLRESAMMLPEKVAAHRGGDMDFEDYANDEEFLGTAS